MIVIPNTEVRLLSNVPLINTYEHQRTFANTTDQANYFIGKNAHRFTDFTYQREDQTIKVPKGRDSLYNCNYLMYRNSEFSTKWFYAFITKLEYVNPNMTIVHFEIDVYQTWQFDIEFKPSFVEREHCKRWNADGTPVVNTVDEGLDYGSEYVTKSIKQYVPFNDVFFLVIVCQKRMDVNGGGVEPTVNGSIQPLTYYVHPFRLNGSIPNITVDGINQPISPIKDVLKALYKSTVSVNNIAALYITEHIGVESLAFSMANFEPVNVQDDNNNFVTLYVKNKPTYTELSKSFGDKYSDFSSVTESKLLMHPYTTTVLTDMKGNSQELKNEFIQHKDLWVMCKGSIGTSNKVSYHVWNYLMDETMGDAPEVAISHGIINNSPNDVPIITDLLSAYLQGNRNTIANQTNQIMFNNVANAIGSGMGAIGSAMSGNAVGAVSGIAGIATGAVNSYFQIEGLMAKQKDLDATPPQLSKMGGNTAFDYGNGIQGLYIIKKEITPEHRKRLSDYFKMYGYKVNELKTPNIKTRQHFNFVKTVGANIYGNVPQNDINKIKEMFNTGVTLWHGDWVGDYTRANNEI